MEITTNRMKHILAVANKMHDIVMSNPKDYKCSPEEAYVLGLLHDMGYAFVSEPSEHANKGGLILREQGYKYWKEVYYHGVMPKYYNSPLLELLNYADMTTGPNGEDMTIQQRIEDIANRYGKGSIQEINAKKLASFLVGF